MYPEFSFKSQFLTLDGKHRLHFIDEGAGNVIVLLHGNPTWSFYYRRLIKLLAKNSRVIAPDHLGCGMSDKPQDYQYILKNHIENTESLLNHLGVDTYSLVLHDWGGPIGLGCTLKHPQRIKKILLLNTAGFRSRKIPLRISLCKLPVIGKFIVRGLNGFCWPATFMAVEKPLSKDVRLGYLAPYDSWKNRVAINAFVRDIPLSDSHESYEMLVKIEEGLETLRNLKTPIMIVWGAKDFCFNDSFYYEWLRRFPEAEHHYLEDCGHYVLEDGWPQVGVLAEQFFHSTESDEDRE